MFYGRVTAEFNQSKKGLIRLTISISGPFLTLILDDLKLKSQNRLRPNHKIKFWSGFDTTILKLLYTMKETQPSLDKAEELLETDYNGALMIELHLIKNEYYIKVGKIYCLTVGICILSLKLV